MMTLLLAAFLLWQEQSDQARVGVLTGILRDASGKVQANVRVAAMAVDENSDTEVLVSIGRTNEAGEFRLDVPPGEYYVVAGRVDQPTYYPGASDRSNAKRLIVAATSVHVADFAISATSLQPHPYVELEGLVAKQKAIMEVLAMRVNPPSVFVRLRNEPTVTSETFFFSLSGVIGRNMSFLTETGRFSHDCADCSFFVTKYGVVPQSTEPGVLFKLSADGRTLNYTCYAKSCNVAQPTSTGINVATISANESGSTVASQRVGFAVNP